MVISADSKVLKFRCFENNDDSFDDSFIPDAYSYIISNLTRVDGEVYYYKDVSQYRMLNELIGSYLAKKIQLDSVDYQIGILENEQNNNLYALSKVLFERDYDYLETFDYLGTTNFKELGYFESLISPFYFCMTRLLNLVDNDKLKEDILKLTVLDLRMGQTDRHTGNLMLKKDSTGMVRLAPVFDYGMSYLVSPDYCYPYDNPFLIVKKNKLSLRALASKYPEIVDLVEFICKIDVNDVLEEIIHDKQIFVSDRMRYYYQEFDKGYTKKLKQVMKKRF